MKTLIAAVIASVVSFGAFAQTSPATGASAPMSKPMASDSMSKPMASDSTKAHKATKKHAAKKASKKASAPAA
jgi:hypothetical protein